MDGRIEAVAGKERHESQFSFTFFFDFRFHDSDVMGSALMNTASARGFSKACLACHGFENLDFAPVAESTARVKAFGASDPRRALRWPRVWEGSSPSGLRCAATSFYGHGREDVQRLHRGQGTDVALSVWGGGVLPPYGAFTWDRKAVTLCWEVSVTPVCAQLLSLSVACSHLLQK